jgi:electron-transferring-flavoprotein dehydrogenase
VRPADFPPPFDPAEFVREPTDPADERIDVGILIVGGGPAGLAAAIRAGQLLEARPELAERLGDVSIAVLDKGKAPGAHLLSGAVVNPHAFRQLFPGTPTSEFPFIGAVESEGVYYLTRRSSLRIPAPPPMWNHGNYVASVDELSRWLTERAEELGVVVIPETSATHLLVQAGRVVGVRTGDKGRGRNGEELPNFEAGSDIKARVTILAEGTQGHLTGVALDRFGLQSKPQVWALGVKEVWEVEKPLHRIIHTMGWPLRGAPHRREFGGSFVYPMGENRVALGMVVGLDYTDSTLSVHGLLQDLKTHPKIRKILKGGSRVAWGAKTIPEGGYLAFPDRFHMPGAMIVGDGAGFVNVPALKGIHYAMRTGMLAAETAVEAIGPGRTAWAPGALAGYDDAIRDDYVWKDLKRVRNVRAGFKYGFWRGAALAGMSITSLGMFPRRDFKIEADAGLPVGIPKKPRQYPAADGTLTFDKLSSVYLSGNKTRDDAPSHIRVRRGVAPEVADAWVHMCPAAVYELQGTDRDGLATVEVTASNCVQCGAITAKGGRLTPAEGGSGPEYTVM